MPRVHWPLRHGRPWVEVSLTLAADGQPFLRFLLADTCAGSRTAPFELILDIGSPTSTVTVFLKGVYYLPKVACRNTSFRSDTDVPAQTP